MPGKTAVIYKSKYGSTGGYARLIANELGCPLFEWSEFQPEMFAGYDTVIYGGGIYAGAILGSALLSKNAELLKDKKVIVFATGVTHMDEQQEKAVLDRNFDGAFQKNIRFFFLKGNFHYASLRLPDRIIITFLKMVLSKKDPKDLTAAERDMLDGLTEQTGRVRLENAAPVIECAKESI